MNVIDEFVSKFGAHLSLKKSLIIENKNRYFLLNENLRRLVDKNFFYAGAYLGKIKGEKFFPSFILLKMIANSKATKIYVDAKAAWLFICRRDIFKQGIVKIEGFKKKGAYTLVLNQYGECLGFGRILCDLYEEIGKVVIKNVSDIGDFLRRER